MLNQDVLFHQGDTLLYPTVTCDPANAYITWVQDSFTSIPDLTENQTSVGGGLDGSQDADPGGVVTYLNAQNTANLATMYDLIAPDELTALFEIGFANAEIQNVNMERHLELVRRDSGMTRQTEYTRSTRDSKGGVVEQTRTVGESRPWSIYLEGTGGSATVDSSRNAAGYDFDTYGMTLGADRRVNDYCAVGSMGGYANSDASLENNGSIDIDTYKAAVYATVFRDGLYADALLGAGYNEYDTSRGALLGYAEGSSDGWELDTLVSAGISIQFTPVLTGYAFYDGQIGSSSYNSNTVSVGLKDDF